MLCDPPITIDQTTETLVLSHLDYCSIIWSSANQRDLGKLQLAQNRAARLALQCPSRSNVDVMHGKLSWVKVKDGLTVSLIVFLRNIRESKYPTCLYTQLRLSSDTHEYNTRHATRGCYQLPKAKKESMQRTVLYRAMVAWNALPEKIIKDKTKPGFKKQLKSHLAAQK